MSLFDQTNLTMFTDCWQAVAWRDMMICLTKYNRNVERVPGSIRLTAANDCSQQTIWHVQIDPSIDHKWLQVGTLVPYEVYMI